MRKTWFWIYQIFEGRPIIWGPMGDEIEAHEKGRSKLNGDYKVVELPTSDMAYATRIIKSKILDETGDLERALRRARHGEIPQPYQKETYEGD